VARHVLSTERNHPSHENPDPQGCTPRRYEEDLVAWKEGRRTAKPKFHLVCFEPTSLGWWGGVSYTTGALLYNIGASPDASCLASRGTLLRKRPELTQTRR